MRFIVVAFILLAVDVSAYEYQWAFEPYCDDAGCYSVDCSAPWYQGQYDLFQDVGPDYEGVRCDFTQYCLNNPIECANVHLPDQFELDRGYEINVGSGLSGFSDVYKVCGVPLIYQRECGTQASPYSMGGSSSAWPVDFNEVTFKPDMWSKNYWINTLLGCGPIWAVYTALDINNPQDNSDCPAYSQASGFWFDLTLSEPYGSGNKCFYSYNNGPSYTSDNMTPCGYCLNQCEDWQKHDSVTCDCYSPVCPQGQKWSELAGSCVVDPCPPPLFDTGGGVCDINCPQIKQGLTCLTCAEFEPTLPLFDPVAQICVPDVASCTDLLGQAWMFDYNGVCAQCWDIERNNDNRAPDSFTAFDAYPQVTIDMLYDGAVTVYDNQKFINEPFQPPFYPLYPAGLYSRDYPVFSVNCPNSGPPEGPYIYTPESINFFYDPVMWDGIHGRFFNVAMGSGFHEIGASINYVDSLTLDVSSWLYVWASNECNDVSYELGYIEPSAVPQYIPFEVMPDYYEVCVSAGVYHPACGMDVKVQMGCVTKGAGSIANQGKGSKHKGSTRKQEIHKHLGRRGYEKRLP